MASSSNKTAGDSRADLALPDYDQLDPESLRERLEPLTAAQVERLRDHAASSGASTETTEVLDTRLESLRDALRGDSADDQQGAPFAHRGAGSAPGGVSPQTSGPPINPPSHGDPTNPAQPRG